MNMQQSNPYAEFGTTVTESRFIGRDKELRAIEARVFGTRGFGSIAIVGLPRVGKTSLVFEAIRRATSDASKQNIVVARVDVGIFDSVDDLLRCLVEDIAESVRTGKFWNDSIQDKIHETLASPIIDFNAVRALFKLLRQKGLRPVCVLDEFDAGRRVFRKTPQFFHWLRELCSNPSFKAAVVLIAKRSLQDIARLTGYRSNYWANVLTTLPLKPFSDRDVSRFFSILQNENISLNEIERRELLSFVGSHPYLLDAFAYYAWEHQKQGGHIDVNWLGATCGRLVREYHQQITEILRDGPMLSKVIQVVVGPRYDVTTEDVAALCELGVLQDENHTFRGFSQAFEDHLRIAERSVDVWPLWRDTERILRSVLESNLEERFGSEWPSALSKLRPKLGLMIEECQRKRDSERNRLGFRNPKLSLLSYSYPMDLYRLMCADWASLGEPLLGQNKQGWAEKFATLAKVRTPLAHNRAESVDEGERKQTEGICQEILNRYHNLLAKRPSIVQEELAHSGSPRADV